VISQSFIKHLKELVIYLGEQAEKIKYDKYEVRLKENDSPLTIADKIINEELISFLITKSPHKFIISEENKNIQYEKRRSWDYFWMIDPIDGTKEFIKKGHDYTINIALCHINTPVFGIVYAPASKTLYHAIKGMGAYKNNIKIRCVPHLDSLKIVASSSHLNQETKEFIDNLKEDNNCEIVNIGSSLKICFIADGTAHVYPRFGPTMEWDTCASQVILEEAGGALKTIDNKILVYNKENLLNPFFIATNNFSI